MEPAPRDAIVLARLSDLRDVEERGVEGQVQDRMTMPGVSAGAPWVARRRATLAARRRTWLWLAELGDAAGGDGADLGAGAGEGECCLAGLRGGGAGGSGAGVDVAGGVDGVEGGGGSGCVVAGRWGRWGGWAW